MKKPAKKKALSSKKDSYMTFTYLALMGTLIFRIFLGNMIGDKGIAYFGVANELYLAVGGAVSFGLTEAAALQIRYRMRRSQFKGAGRILRSGLMLGGCIGLIFSIIVGFLGNSIAEKFFHIPLAGMAVSLIAPAMFFSIITGVLRGYFQGIGSKVPVMHSQALYTIFLFIGGLIGTALWRGYGEKVAALLQNPDCTGAYGAMGASIGPLVASIFCFLHALIMFFIFKKTLQTKMGREGGKNQDVKFPVVLLASTGIFYFLYFFSFHALPLLDQYLLFSLSENVSGLVSQWGAYYGKYLVVIGMISGVIDMICLPPVRRIAASFERDDPHLAKAKLGALIHQCAAISIPLAVFLAVMAENVLDLFFSGSLSQAALWVRAGSVIIVLYAFVSVFMELLIRGRKMKLAAGIGVIAFLVHMGLGMLLLKTTKMGMMAIIVSSIVFYAVAAILGFLLMASLFQYRQEWIRCFGITIVASAVSGGAALLINKLLGAFLGNVISLLICLLAAGAVYMVLLVVTRAFDKEEMEEIAGGRILVKLAELLHFS